MSLGPRPRILRAQTEQRRRVQGQVPPSRVVSHAGEMEFLRNAMRRMSFWHSPAPRSRAYLEHLLRDEGYRIAWRIHLRALLALACGHVGIVYTVVLPAPPQVSSQTPVRDLGAWMSQIRRRLHQRIRRLTTIGYWVDVAEPLPGGLVHWHCLTFVPPAHLPVVRGMIQGEYERAAHSTAAAPVAVQATVAFSEDLTPDMVTEKPVRLKTGSEMLGPIWYATKAWHTDSKGSAKASTARHRPTVLQSRGWARHNALQRRVSQQREDPDLSLFLDGLLRDLPKSDASLRKYIVRSRTLQLP